MKMAFAKLHSVFARIKFDFGAVSNRIRYARATELVRGSAGAGSALQQVEYIKFHFPAYIIIPQ